MGQRDECPYLEVFYFCFENLSFIARDRHGWLIGEISYIRAMLDNLSGTLTSLSQDYKKYYAHCIVEKLSLKEVKAQHNIKSSEPYKNTWHWPL
jgi:hypothetical protein